jgi:outer membrane protein TolC
LRLEVSRDFLTGPRRQAERGIAEVDVKAADADIAAAERMTDASVVRAAVSAAIGRSILARLTQQDVLLSSAEENLRSRFSTGDSRYVDVLRMRTERLKIQGERNATMSETRIAEIQLASMLGQPAVHSTVNAQLDTLATMAWNQSFRKLLPQIPGSDSLVALSAEVQARQIDEARVVAANALSVAQRKTQLNGYAGIQRIGQANNGPTIGPSVGISMTLPFTAARASERSLAAEREAATGAAIATESARSMARARIEIDVERFQSGVSRLESFDNAILVGAREERESALSSFRNGDLTLSELLDFERALSDAEIARLRALIETFDAWADLVGRDNSDVMTSHSNTSPKSR